MNLFTGKIENMIDNGIIEPLQIKENILLFGTECAATIIRINQFLYQGEFNFK
jgi:chaperonin GroEL (HSP60 family)